MYDILNEHLQELKENIRIGLGSIEIKVQEISRILVGMGGEGNIGEHFCRGSTKGS